MIISFLLLLLPFRAVGQAVGDVRLVNGNRGCEGRVEVFYNGQWGTVCDDDWGFDDANVVCLQVGCGPAVSAPRSAYFGQGSGPIWMDDVRCTGQNTLLHQCQFRGWGRENCEHYEDASAICNDPCPTPSGIPGGTVSYTGISSAVYSCDDDFFLVGQSITRCLLDSTWSNSPPTCYASVITFQSNQYTAIEGVDESVTITVIRRGDNSSDVGVIISITGENLAMIDVSSNFIVAANENSSTLTLPIGLEDDVIINDKRNTSIVLSVNDTDVGVINNTAVITVLDNDGAVVGLERTHYNVSEEDGEIEVCAIIRHPNNVECPVEIIFRVLLFATDGSAVASNDYDSLSNLLEFNPCETRVCTDVTIVNDNWPESAEFFTISLEMNSGQDGWLSIDPAAAQVEILLNDDMLASYSSELTVEVVSETSLRVSWNENDIDTISSIVKYECVVPQTDYTVAKIEKSLPYPEISTYFNNNLCYYDPEKAYKHTVTLIQNSNTAGEEPIQTSTSFSMDYEYFQIQFGAMKLCLDWKVEEQLQIESKLKLKLTDVILDSCSNCTWLSESFIGQGYFTCRTNPTTPTYRSYITTPFLNGTRALDLLTVIERWISSAPIVPFDLLLVRLNPRCPIAISNLNEPECLWE